MTPRPQLGSARAARRVGSLAALAAALTLAPAPAPAHPVTSRTENNRYVKLTVAGDRLRVAYAVLYGELPSFYARRAMDQDGDGRVSPAEARAHADELAASLAPLSVLTVDGVRVPLRLPDRAATMTDPRVGPIPFAIELGEEVALKERPARTISFEPGGELPRLGETEVKFAATPPTRLVTWCRGRPPCASRAEEPRFVWLGPRASSMEDRTVSAQLARPATSRRRWIGAGTGAALLLAVVMVVVVARRRRRKR